MATTEKDYYALLGVSRAATDDEIKRAFRRKARDVHPDVNDSPDAEHRFRELAEAYEVLSNPEARRLYDRYGVAGLRQQGYQGARPDFDFGNLADIFGTIFGERIFGAGMRSQPARGADATAVVEVTLADAFAGRTVLIPVSVAADCDRCGGSGAEPGTSPVGCPECSGTGRVQRVSNSLFGQFVRAAACDRCDGSGRLIETPCSDCAGAGRSLQQRTLSVDVPPGIHDGQRIRLKGEGHAGALGGPPGDLFVQVRVLPHDRLEREGDDLIAHAGLTITEAALGATVSIPTPEGEVELRFDPGTQPGDVRVLRGQGMPLLGASRRGDLRVLVDVRVPRSLTKEQRALLETLGESLGDRAFEDDRRSLLDRLRSALR